MVLGEIRELMVRFVKDDEGLRYTLGCTTPFVPEIVGLVSRGFMFVLARSLPSSLKFEKGPKNSWSSPAST
jgi:hypothetical protein